MADSDDRKPSKPSRWSRCLLVFGWLTALSVIYIASIGPLALLESQGIGTDQPWRTLQQTVYSPVFRVVARTAVAGQVALLLRGLISGFNFVSQALRIGAK